MDTIANFLTQIQNAYMAHHQTVTTPWSKLREELAKLLVKEGYLTKSKTEKVDESKKNLVLSLKFDEQDRPIMTKVKRVSKPGRRVYTKVDSIPVTLNGIGTTIISTSKGLMTGKEAKGKNLGGEVICQLY